MFHADQARTVKRRADLQSYIEQHLLDAGGVFCCSQYNASCLPSARASGLSFTEGEMPHVGRHYDLIDDDGRDYRVVVVGQERGRGVPRAAMEDWWKRIMHVARREVVPDPTIKGITLALMELYGLSRYSWGTYERETIEVDGSAVHVLDCFGLTNSTLCSATLPGQPTKGRATTAMKGNCSRHLGAMLNILQPTILILLGKSARDAAMQALNLRLEQNEPSKTVIRGTDCDIFPFAHPLNRETPWRSATSHYLRQTILPTLRVGELNDGQDPTPVAGEPRDVPVPPDLVANPGSPVSSTQHVHERPAYVASAPGAGHTDKHHLLLVGCLQETETQRVLDEFKNLGRAASPWSFRLTDEQQAALRDCPHLYVYRPASSWLRPNQAVVECLRVDDWDTKPYGIPCPWNGLGQQYGQTTTLLDGQPIKTWFRIVAREVLSVPITARHSLRARDGRPVNPKSPGLLSSFSLWTLKEGASVSLPCIGE